MFELNKGKQMTYPEFFKQIPTITLHDPLANFLGNFESGLITYEYLDLVKMAGHSCPTVAGAYLMTYKALEALYPHCTPVRGDIAITFHDDLTHETTGVTATAMSHITGANDAKGFKGIQTHFKRNNLLTFNASITAPIRFTRTDTQTSVDVRYNPNLFPPHPEMMPLMKKQLSGSASLEEKNTFQTLWQKRVATLLIENFNNAKLVSITKV